MKPVTALGIVGSARKSGNTSRLVDQILAGASAAGAETDKLFLIDQQIKPCLGCPCYVQKPKRTCVQDDDLLAIGARMEKAKLIVVSTPIYWYGPSGLFKNFLDRWIGLPESVFEDTYVAAALTMQDVTPETAGPTREMLERSFSGGRWVTYAGDLLVSGLHHTPNAIEGRKDLLDQGFAFGESLMNRILNTANS